MRNFRYTNVIRHLRNYLMKQSTKKSLFEFLQVVVFAAITTFIAAAFLDSNWFKAIYLGVFIVIFYYTYTVFTGMIEESLHEKKDGFFHPKLYTILVYSLVLLGTVTLISGILFSYTIDYCNKDKFYYSEERCKLKEAENRILENYDTGYDDSDYDY